MNLSIVYLFLLSLLVSCLGGSTNSLNVKTNKSISSGNNPPNCTQTEINRYAKKDVSSYPLENFISCEDPDGDLVTYYLKTAPSYGDIVECLGLSITSTFTYLEKHTDLSCVYTARKSFEGTDTIIYTATDGKDGGETDIKVNLIVKENSAPVAYVGQVMQVDRAAGAQSLDAIKDATDVDSGDILSYAILTYPTNGTLSYCLGLNGTTFDDRTCIYTPTITGSDSFTYKVTDNSGAYDIGTVTLKDVNSEGPSLISSYTVYVKMNEGTQTLKSDLTFAADKDLVTTSNIFSDTLVYTLQTAPTYGTLKSCLDLTGAVDPKPDVTCLYTPNTDFQGTDSLTYRVTDPAGNYIDTVVSIEVYNSPPTGISKTIDVWEDAGAQAFDLTALISDNEGGLYKVIGISPVNSSNEFDGVLSNGVLTNCMGLSGSASLTDSNCVYTPNADFNGSDTFDYRVIDIQGAYQDYTITLNVNNVPDNPIWNAQIAQVRENGGLQQVTFVGATAVDVGATNFSYSVTVLPATGTLANCMGLNGSSATDLTCEYTPAANAVGDVGFTAQVSDGVGGVTTTGMTIRILTTNQKPVFSSSSVSFTIAENTDGTAGVTNIDIPSATDPDAGDTLTYLLTKSPKGTLSNCTAQMDCDYFPPTGLWGTPGDYYEVTVYDNESYYSTLRVNINLTQNNRTPTFAVASTTLTVSEYPGVALSLSGAVPSAADVDPNDTLTYSVSVYPQRGTVSNCLGLNGSSKTDLSCDYTINASIINYFDINNDYDQFTVRVFDGENGYATTVIVVRVLPVNSNPVIVSGINNVSFTKNSPVQLKVVVDEGGGIDEDAQSLTLTMTSDQTIIKPADVTLSFGTDKDTATVLAGDISTGINIGDGLLDAKSYYLFIDMKPSYLGNSEISSTLTFTLSDSNAPAGSVAKAIQVTANNRVVYEHGGWKEAYAQGPTVLRDHSYKTGSNDTKVRLKWDLPIVSGSLAGTYTISGWNIYRSSQGPESYYFDFSSPLNGSTLLTTKEYTDTSTAIQVDANSNAGKVFWYRVRPYIGSSYIAGYSPTNDQTIRVVVPPRNKSLIHHWMANKYVCELNLKTIDRANNYRCTYVGPGNTLSGGGNYFEITKDFLIDRFGIGCPYSENACTFTNPGQPIDGQTTDCFTHEYGTPIASVDGATIGETIYYDRTTTKCSYYKAAATWEDFNTKYTNDADLAPLSDTLLNKYSNYPKLPPLTSLDQNAANYYCKQAISNVDILYNSGGVYKSTVGHLMTRREYFASSLWPSSITHYEVISYESGTTMTTNGSNKKCNTKSADSLSFTPAGYDSDTMPNDDGTYPLLLNGSTASSGCQSVFGVQDMVGNTWEISADRVDCAADDTCTGRNGAFRLDTHADMTDLFISHGGTNYDFDDVIGPCDINGDTLCNTSDIILMKNDATASQLYYYIGLPVMNTYADAVSNYRTLGTSTNVWVHNDESIVDAASVNAGTKIGALLYGGSYASGGDAAGVFSTYVIDSDATSENASFRCINYIDN